MYMQSCKHSLDKFNGFIDPGNLELDQDHFAKSKHEEVRLF